MVTTIAESFIFLAKGFVCVVTTLLGYILIDVMVKTPIDKTGPCLVIFLLSYIVGTTFIQAFDDGANTILQCYLIDKDVFTRNPERSQKHIPKSLKEFIK
jgi:hypothetical protein